MGGGGTAAVAGAVRTCCPYEAMCHFFGGPGSSFFRFSRMLGTLLVCRAPEYALEYSPYAFGVLSLGSCWKMWVLPLCCWSGAAVAAREFRFPLARGEE